MYSVDVKVWQDMPSNQENRPALWPALALQVLDDSVPPADGLKRYTYPEYLAYLEEQQASYDTWLAGIQETEINRIAAAIAPLDDPLITVLQLSGVLGFVSEKLGMRS